MIILVGPSASGKTEVVKELTNNYNYKKLVTYTSRMKRVHEVDGSDYHFITNEDFLNKIKNGFFFEYVIYNNNYYGTANEDITIDKVVILEPKGFEKYHNSSLTNLLSFFLDASIEKRIERMNMRGDNIDKINERIESDINVFNLKEISGIDFVIDSNSLSIKEMAREINNLYKRRILENAK